MSETITTAVSDRICKHMNDDHGDALVFYAKHYGNVENLNSAKMLSIDNEGMFLIVDENEKNPLRIIFDHTLIDAKDAHHTLVEMLKSVKN